MVAPLTLPVVLASLVAILTLIDIWVAVVVAALETTWRGSKWTLLVTAAILLPKWALLVAVASILGNDLRAGAKAWRDAWDARGALAVAVVVVLELVPDAAEGLLGIVLVFAVLWAELLVLLVLLEHELEVWRKATVEL